MVALTRDLHVFTSRVTTRISAILLSISYIAKAWYVRALSRVLIRHFAVRFLSFEFQPFSSIKAFCLFTDACGFPNITFVLASIFLGVDGTGKQNELSIVSAG